MHKTDHIFIISYNRPLLLQKTLAALSLQTYKEWQITLFQDGPRDARDTDEKTKVRQCVETFRSIFPCGQVVESATNLGIGLNILAAQQRAFIEQRLDVAFFFEDDLVPYNSYIAQLIALRDAISPHRYIAPYFACYGDIHSFCPEREHIPGSGLRFMDSFWGYGLFREHWEEDQALLEPYFAYLKTVPYQHRNHTIIENIFRKLGRPRSSTSQDSARIVSLLIHGRCAVTTMPRRASYLGFEGEHSTAANYKNWGFKEEQPKDEPRVITPQLCSAEMRNACAKFALWVVEMDEMPPNQIARLQASNSVNNQHIAAKDQEIRARNQEISAKDQEIDAKNREISSKNREIDAKNQKIEGLLQDLSAMRNKLRAMHSSTSWRITSPLRWVADKARFEQQRMSRAKQKPQLRHISGVVALDISNIWNFDAGTGIQRVVRTIATELARKNRDGKKVVLINYQAGIPLDVTSGFLDGNRAAPIVPTEGMETIIMLDSSYNLAPSLASQLRQAKENGIRIVSVCHDLLPIRFPHWFIGMNHGNFRRWLQVAAAYSNHFVCVSRATANDLGIYLDARRDLLQKPSVTTWPLGRDFASLRQTVTGNEITLPKPYAVMVGTVEPRKNHAFVLDAFKRLRGSGKISATLVVVGRHGWKCDRVAKRLRQAEREGWAVWLDEGISDVRLASIYTSAACAIQASLAEGFGLPVAEAAHFGKPVVLSDIPVFKEIVRANGYFFRPDDYNSFAAALIRALPPAARPTETIAVTWRESAEAFWRECIGFQTKNCR